MAHLSSLYDQLELCQLIWLDPSQCSSKCSVVYKSCHITSCIADTSYVLSKYTKCPNTLPWDPPPPLLSLSSEYSLAFFFNSKLPVGYKQCYELCQRTRHFFGISRFSSFNGFGRLRSNFSNNLVGMIGSNDIDHTLGCFPDMWITVISATFQISGIYSNEMLC